MSSDIDMIQTLVVDHLLEKEKIAKKRQRKLHDQPQKNLRISKRIKNAPNRYITDNDEIIDLNRVKRSHDLSHDMM